MTTREKLKQRGYASVYQEGETNHCPGCHRTHWIIGRLMAECAFCATAIPLPATDQRNSKPTITRRSGSFKPMLGWAA